MGFYDDPKSVDEYEKMCEGYDGSKIYEMLRRHLKDGSTLLELGMGPGTDIPFLMEHFSVTGSDLSDEFIKRCRKKFPELPYVKLDAVSIETTDMFDCIYSNKVLHHLSPEHLSASFVRQREVLHPGGIFAHTFWLGNQEFEQNGLTFYFHDRQKLLDNVSKSFELLEVLDYAEFEDGDSIFIVSANSCST